MNTPDDKNNFPTDDPSFCFAATQPELEIELTDRNAVLSVISSYGIQFTSIIMNFFIKIILARLILPEAWGLFAEALLVLSVFELARDFGMSQHLIRDQDPPYGNALILEVSMAVTILLLIQFIAPTFSFLDSQIPGILRVLFIVGVIKAFSVLPETYMYRNLLLKKSIIPSIVATLANAAVSIFLAWRGYGVWSLVFGLMASTIVATLCYWILFYRYIPLEFTLKHSISLLSGGKYLFLFGAVGFLSSRVDIAIAGSMLTPEKTGYYFMTLSLVFWPSRLIEGALHNVMYPIFSDWKEDAKKVAGAYRFVTRLVVTIEVPIYVFLFFAVDTVVPVLLGPKWIPVIPLAKILTLVAIMDPITMFGLDLLRSTGQDRILILSSIFTFFALALGGWFLAGTYGIQGLALSRFLILGSIPIVIAVAKTIKDELKGLFEDIIAVYITYFFSLGLINYIFANNQILSLFLSGILICVLSVGFYNIYFKDKLEIIQRILFKQTFMKPAGEGKAN